MMPGLKNFAMFFCAFLWPFFVSAQEIAPLSKKDSSNVLISIATEKFKSAPQESERLLISAHVLARTANYVKGQARSLHLLARIRKDANRTDEAIQNYLEAAKLYEQLNDSTLAGRCYTSLASIYIYQLNNYTRGHQYCTQAVTLLANDSVYLPSAESNLASLYVQTQKFDEALVIYHKSYNSERRNNNLRGMCLALNNIATAYDYKRDFLQSYSHYEQALHIARTLNDTKMVSHILIGMSPVQCELGNHKLSYQLAAEALTIAREDKVAATQISALCLLAYEGAMHDHKFEEAKNLMLEAERLANTNNLHMYKREIYGRLSNIFHKWGKEKEALKYRTKVEHLMDSMATQERLAVTEFAKENAERRASNVHTTTSAGFPVKAGPLAVGVVMVLAGIGFVFYKTTQERKIQNEGLQTSSDSASTPKLPNEDKVLPAEDPHLEVLHGQGVKLVPLREIWWFQKDGKLYQAVTKDGQYRMRQNITELEDLLHNTHFFRINRSAIINIDQMNNYSFWENHKYIVRMKDPSRTEFIISRNRLREMKEAFQVMEA